MQIEIAVELGGSARDAMRSEADEAESLIPKLQAGALADLRDSVVTAAGKMRREVALPATLLVGDQPQTFGEADRLRGEGELRLAVVPPVVALSSLLAITENVAWLSALLGAAILLWEGVAREDEARSLVAKAIAHNKVPSAARDAFAEDVRRIQGLSPGTRRERRFRATERIHGAPRHHGRSQDAVALRSRLGRGSGRHRQSIVRSRTQGWPSAPQSKHRS